MTTINLNAELWFGESTHNISIESIVDLLTVAGDNGFTPGGYITARVTPRLWWNMVGLASLCLGRSPDTSTGDLEFMGVLWVMDRNVTGKGTARAICLLEQSEEGFTAGHKHFPSSVLPFSYDDTVIWKVQ